MAQRAGIGSNYGPQKSGTFSGGTITSNLTISNTAPALMCTDTTTNADDARWLMDANTLTLGFDTDDNGTYDVTSASVASATGQWTFSADTYVSNGAGDRTLFVQGTGSAFLDLSADTDNNGTGDTASISFRDDGGTLVGNLGYSESFNRMQFNNGSSTATLIGNTTGTTTLQGGGLTMSPADGIMVQSGTGGQVWRLVGSTGAEMQLRDSGATSGVQTGTVRVDGGQMFLSGYTDGYAYTRNLVTFDIDDGDAFFDGDVVVNGSNVTITGSSATTLESMQRNSNNASATAHAAWRLRSGGASGGDPYVIYDVTGEGAWSVGYDNTDDAFKWAYGGNATIADDTLAMSLSTGGALTTTGDLTVSGGNITAATASAGGTVVGLALNNDSTDANSAVVLELRAAGSTTQSAYARYLANDATTADGWAAGLITSTPDYFAWNYVAGGTPDLLTGALEMTLDEDGDVSTRGDVNVSGNDITGTVGSTFNLLATHDTGAVNIATGLTTGALAIGTSTSTSTLALGTGTGTGVVTIGAASTTGDGTSGNPLAWDARRRVNIPTGLAIGLAASFSSDQPERGQVLITENYGQYRLDTENVQAKVWNTNSGGTGAMLDLRVATTNGQNAETAALPNDPYVAYGVNLKGSANTGVGWAVGMNNWVSSSQTHAFHWNYESGLASHAQAKLDDTPLMALSTAGVLSLSGQGITVTDDNPSIDLFDNTASADDFRIITDSNELYIQPILDDDGNPNDGNALVINGATLNATVGGDLTVSGGNFFLNDATKPYIALHDTSEPFRMQISVDGGNTLVLGSVTNAGDTAGDGIAITASGGTAVRSALDVTGTIEGNLATSVSANALCYSGTIGTNNGIGSCSSSRRYKTNVRDITDAQLGKLWALRPVSFEMRKTPGTRYGVIAEEVEKVAPEMVLYDGAGRVEGVHEFDFKGLLIAGVQWLRAQVLDLWDAHDEHERRIAELEARLAALEARQ